MASDGIAKRWRELHGAQSWNGLLDPLDIDLRKSIISYGELAEATYDGFNNERRSPHAGACMYGHDELLSKSGVAAAGHYRVTKFIYATSGVPLPDAFLLLPLPALKDVWSRDSNFMGYVAVATDEGAAALGRRRVLEEVRRLMEMFKDEERSITVTGHSLGGALSTLNAVDMVAAGVNASCPVTAVVFASPHVGDRFFRAAFGSFEGLRAPHVKNLGDVVHAYPPLGYVDAAVALHINTSRSPYLAWPGTVLTMHNLECYLHGVAGEQGSAGGFRLEVERDVALVNKGADALKDEYPVPASWWVAQHKGMVKNDQGKWELRDFVHV
ncbi:hypothetical protein HU200_020209 [Digitaria exilis]|uniref:Phospholipase A1 n=1 Tax=Digitaria exilis TaxID=1010633 RepID=A0A835F1S8_9POAL|nr:hypothetical protein HU200_020209 [Digitaria exilis]